MRAQVLYIERKYTRALSSLRVTAALGACARASARAPKFTNLHDPIVSLVKVEFLRKSCRWFLCAAANTMMIVQRAAAAAITQIILLM